MNEETVIKILALAHQMERFEIALRLKCEICRPKLMGYPGNYPICKRHDIDNKRPL